MVSREDIAKTYSGLSTDELLAIVREQGGYTALAISAAQEELAKRNVTEAQVLEFDERIEQAKTVARQSASEELSFLQKCFFYFIWVPLLHFPIKQNLREDGFVLKVRQAGYYSIAGFISFILTALISAAINLSDLLSIMVWALLILPACVLDKYFNKRTQLF
jgi:hypothetical protein